MADPRDATSIASAKTTRAAGRWSRRRDDDVTSSSSSRRRRRWRWGADRATADDNGGDDDDGRCLGDDGEMRADCTMRGLYLRRFIVESGEL
jgi:hypothetical protein